VALKTIAALAIVAAAASAQTFEVGAAVGTGIYRDATVTSASGTAQAGMDNGIAPGVVVCDNMFEHVSGEFRYLYQPGQPFVSQGAVKGSMPGNSHTFVYDTLLHVRGRDRRIRPYAAIGVGVKGYLTPGPAPSPEPLPKVAALLAKNQWSLVGSVGGGIKVKVQEHIVLRFDIRDYVTQFPKNQISAAPGASVSGLLQQITPMGGVGIVF
jgi:outer membrane protein W